MLSVAFAFGLGCLIGRDKPTTHRFVPHLKMAEESTNLAQEAVSAEWDAMADRWEDIATGYSTSFEKILWQQTELNPNNKDMVVLDFGCGTGLLTESIYDKVSEVICIDAAPLMIGKVKDKIREKRWDNVRAYCAVLGDAANDSSVDGGSDDGDNDVGSVLKDMVGRVDLIVASSVFGFIPREDVAQTMKVLGDLLRTGGLLCHSDWPKSEKHPSGFSDEHAQELYRMGGLEVKSMKELKMHVSSEDEVEVFVGVAVKP